MSRRRRIVTAARWAHLVLTVLLAACALPSEPGEAAKPSTRATGAGPVGSAAPAGPPPPTLASKRLPLVAPPFDLASTAAAIDDWPRIIPGVHARSVTSFDRAGGNDDGFGGTFSELYVDERGEHVIFDAVGPGVVRTLWFTSAVDGDAPLGLGTVRFYFDGEDKARVSVDADELFTGGRAPFVLPLVATNTQSSGGFASWAPLPFHRRLRITTAQRPGFYQVHHDALPPDWDVTTFTPGMTDAALAARFAAAANPTSLPLEEVPLDVTRTGAGTIDVVRFVPTVAPTDAALAAARIAIRFDGSESPQVDVPLAFFFGSGRGIARVRSLVWTMDPLLFESRMPMPFWNGARITVTGLGGKLFLRTAPERWSRAEAGTLEVQFRDERPTLATDFIYADADGTGKLVATVLGVDPLTAANKQWWEGDLHTSIDELRTPALHGTGHEDDHLGGWSNEFLSRPFSLPMQGCPRTDLYDTGAEFQKNGASTMYRLWSGIPFYQRIEHATEHGSGNARLANYAAATFLYRQPRSRMVRTDGFDIADTTGAAIHDYDAPGAVSSVLTSRFEGESAIERSGVVDRFDTPARFTLAIDPNNDGVELRRRFDRSEAPARAVLEVDGVAVTAVTTFGPVAPTRLWAEEDVFIPAQLTRAKSAIHVRWIPERSATAARFEARSILR